MERIKSTMSKTAKVSMFRSLVLLAILLLLASPIQAQEEHIYLIKMFDCAHQPTERSQTGFRVRGEKGLVTALHGIADCKKITATSKKGLYLDQPLSIRKIDFDHDIALLSSEQLDDAKEGGLEIADNIVWESIEEVRVYGHPYGIDNLITTLAVREPPIKALKELLPPSLLSALRDRKSPNHLIRVLNLQGNLLPGHSGAPILDSKRRVVAIANGGLREGFSGIVWAVPYEDIEWSSVGSKLRALEELNPSALFSLDILKAQQVDEANDNTCKQLTSLIKEARTEFISIVGEPIGEESFYSKILLSGADYGYVYPKKYVGFYLFSSDNKQKVASQYYSWVSKVSSCFPDWMKNEVDTHTTPKMLRHMFREKANSPIIEIGYNLVLDPSKNHHNYSLRLNVYTTSFGTWY
jgi:trypsin-like peptidase